MSADYHVIEFPLKKNLPAQEIEFVPFGTRTLKILVTNPDPENIKEKLALRTAHLPADFGRTQYFTHEKGGTNFRVSWGGGQEAGVCLNGEDIKKAGVKTPIRVCAPLKDPRYLYLNVTHVKGPFEKSYTLELGVYDVDSDSKPDDANQPPDSGETAAERQKSAGPLYSLDVVLRPPNQIEAGAVNDPIRLEKTSENIFTFKGTDVPAYLDRWWSPSNVNYPQGIPDVPEIKLVADNNFLHVQMKSRNKFKTIAHVEDNILFEDAIDDSRYFDAELYHFHEHTFVLRLWFAWLEKRLSTRFTAEFPDAERFDLLIDAKMGRILYAATDYHWREVWSHVKRPKGKKHLVAHLGMFFDALFDTIGNAVLSSRIDSWLKQATVAIREAEKAEARLKTAEPRIPSRTVRIAVEDEIRAEHLGANIEAHVPSFEFVDPIEGMNFISSDPQKG